MAGKLDICIGKKVMIRQIADGDFFEGSEDQEYADDPSHFEIYDVNTIANYDTEIIPFLESPIGSAFERTPSGLQAVPEGFEPLPDE